MPEWHFGILAICASRERHDDFAASVEIEHNKFIATMQTRSEYAGAEGKILVGPREKFAYMPKSRS